MPVSLLDAYAEILATPQARALANANQYRKLSDMFEATYGASTLLRNEAGNITNVVTSNGFNFTFDSAAGAAEQYIAGNALVTDATFDAASNTLTANFGNIIDGATGTVKKKGLMAGATTGAKFLGGAFAAFGAVMTGVNWYKDNPEFWTDVSQKLLPFAYADPTDKSWGEIFQEALVPTAIDSDGNTYVQADMLQNIYGFLNQQGFFKATLASTIKSDAKVPDVLKGRTFPLTRELFTADPWKTGWHNVKLTTAYNEVYMIRSGYKDIESEKGEVFYISGPFTVDTSKSTTRTYNKNENDYSSGYPLGYLPGNGTENSFGRYDEYFDYEGHDEYLFKAVGTASTWGDYFSTMVFIPEMNWLDKSTWDAINSNFNSFFLNLWHGDIEEKPKLQIDNVNVPDDVKSGDYLPSVYPDWYKNAVTTVNPNWNPNEPESDDNPKYVTWLPLQFPDKDVPDGDTEPDTTLEDAQSGKPKPNTPVDPDTQTALDDGVLPNPYPSPDEEPSINPSPQPQPQPQPTPEPTDPSDPGSIPAPDPTPGVPAIGGGSANALWKIYNPSQAILQSFGRWLWSTDPVKMIKELFSNNPAEGIVGLHMIYVTPPTGGTANIVVGYVDSGVASPWVSQQYVPLDCGSVTLPLRYQSALDFGYTKVYCYLPFIGIVPLDSFDVIGKTVHIRYTVDVLTGTVLAQISVSDGNYSAVLYTFNGSCSVEYPLTSGSRASQVLSLVTGAVGGAVVGGVGGAILGGARGALTGADVRMSGNISGNAGAMGIRKPYIIVKRPVEVAARNYNNFYGYPANATGKLSTFSGYTRVKDVHVENISGATAEEKQEIENLLKSGVILQ